jgi:hypothetical protein
VDLAVAGRLIRALSDGPEYGQELPRRKLLFGFNAAVFTYVAVMQCAKSRTEDIWGKFAAMAAKLGMSTMTSAIESVMVGNHVPRLFD